MVWTGINLAVLVVVVVGWLLYVVVVVVVGCCMLLLLLFHCCLGEEQPLLYVLIFNRSHFTQFHLHHCPLTRKFTQLSYSHNNLPFIAIWHRKPVATLVFCRELAESDNPDTTSVTYMHYVRDIISVSCSFLFSSIGFLTHMTGKCKSTSPSAIQVKFCEITCNKPNYWHKV